MLRAAQALQQKYPDRMELRVAQGVPFDEYRQMMNGSDVILDQLYSYTPSMNALLAMSKGPNFAHRHPNWQTEEWHTS